MRLFVDMDGVLADFDRHHYDVFGTWPNKVHDNVDWNAIRAVPNFYRDIPPMGDMRVLWNYIERYKPIVLTGIPSSVAEAADNKRAWIDRNLGKHVEVRCVRSSTKFEHAARGDVLIDDWEKYRHKWEKAGGVWITHVSATETIKQLQLHVLKAGARRFLDALETCTKCGAHVPLRIPVCEACGEELSAFGKH